MSVLSSQTAIKAMETIWGTRFHQAPHLDWFHSDLKTSFTFSSHNLSKSSFTSCWIFCFWNLVLGLLLLQSLNYLYFSLSIVLIFVVIYLFFCLFFALSFHRRHYFFAVYWWHVTNIIDKMHLAAFGPDLLSVTCLEGVVVSGTMSDWSLEGHERLSGWVLQALLDVWFRIARSGRWNCCSGCLPRSAMWGSDGRV